MSPFTVFHREQERVFDFQFSVAKQSTKEGFPTMADALISLLIETLGSAAFENIKEELSRLTGVEEEIQNLKSTLRDIQAVLDDAEKRQLKETSVRNWLDKLKDASFDIDDLLDEWITRIALKADMEETQGQAEAVNKKVWLSLSSSLCSSLVLEYNEKLCN